MHVAYHKLGKIVGYLFTGTNNNLVLAVDLIPLPSYLTCIVMEVACDLEGGRVRVLWLMSILPWSSVVVVVRSSGWLFGSRLGVAGVNS